MISIKQHKEFALILKSIFFETGKEYNEYLNLYGKTKARTREELKIMDLINELKSLMDNKVLRDYPNIPTEELTRIYYGNLNDM